MPSITPLYFGTTPDGATTHLYRMVNANGMTADVTDLGACLVSLRVPDGRQDFLDVVMGYDGAAGYAVNGPNFGAVVGRHANRIAGASFELDGKTYELAANEKGNSLHSGPDMWQHRLWDVVEAEQGEHDAHVTLALTSPDGDQGFPGELAVRVTYTLTADDALDISYEATPSAPTIVNLTNHSYFNLNGHASGTVLDHTLQVNAEQYCEVTDDLIPTGKLLSVRETMLCLMEPRTLRRGIASECATIVNARGYDHNYALLGEPGEYRHVARLVGDESRIVMDVACDTPGMQVYTGNFVGGERGKGGVHYHDHDAVCLETQWFPDAVHHPEFAQPVFTPEHPYASRTTFSFSVEA